MDAAPEGETNEHTTEYPALYPTYYYERPVPLPSQNPEFQLNSCAICRTEVSNKETHLLYSCSHKVHILCLSKETVQKLRPDDECPICLAKREAALAPSTISQEDYEDSIKKRDKRLIMRLHSFVFDTRFITLSFMKRMSLLKHSKSNKVPMLKLMEQPFSCEYFQEKGIDFHVFMQENLHIQTIYSVLRLQSLEDLQNLGFQTQFFARRDQNNEPLIPLVDFCILYKVTFDDLYRLGPEFQPMTLTDLNMLVPTLDDLLALELYVPRIVKDWKGTKNFFLELPYVPLHFWATRLGMERQHLKALYFETNDYKLLGWTRDLRARYLR